MTKVGHKSPILLITGYANKINNKSMKFLDNKTHSNIFLWNERILGVKKKPKI